uniref:Uncharacterized protein n=1 Tax=Strigamia maritima TaxID=126957 RepID=T1IY57_STRMM
MAYGRQGDHKLAVTTQGRDTGPGPTIIVIIVKSLENMKCGGKSTFLLDASVKSKFESVEDFEWWCDLRNVAMVIKMTNEVEA